MRKSLDEAVTRSPTRLPLPRRLHIEVTNRCNLDCRMCARSLLAEQPRDLSLDDIDRVVSGLPNLESVALQVNGEALLHFELGAIIRYLRRRGIASELNTNGLLLNELRRASLRDAGLSALNVSLDAATAATYGRLRGSDGFHRVVDNTRAFIDERGDDADRTRVSLWMVASRHNIAELPALVRLAARIRADEVFCQRLVLNDRGLATTHDTLHDRGDATTRAAIDEATKLAAQLGVALGGSGRRAPADMLTTPPEPEPWRSCRRPFESAVVLANGDVVPCCIGTFVAPRSDLRMGNVLESDWPSVWHGRPYRSWRRGLERDRHPDPCSGCGTQWSL